MAKFLRLNKKKQLEKRSEVEDSYKAAERKNLYESFCKNDWEEIVSHTVTEEDVLAACRSAVRAKDLAGAVSFLSAVSSRLDYQFVQNDALDKAWQYIFVISVCLPEMDCVMGMFALAEKSPTGFEGEKKLMNLMVEKLMTLSASSRQGIPDSAKQTVMWCRLKGYYAFGFDIALTSNHYDEAFSILVSMETKGEDYVLMLLDVASQMTGSLNLVVPFISVCLERERREFAFSLATRLKQWTVVREQVQSGLNTTSLLRFALSRSVLNENWDLVRLLLEHLPAPDVVNEILACGRRINAGAVVDLLLERGNIPEALKLACSYGLSIKAAQIMRKDFVMDSELSAYVANACFNNHCGPKQFLGVRWSRELLEHIVKAPQRKPFSENQWKCVMNFVEGQCPRQALVVLVERAVREDVSCLQRFVGLGVDGEMMDCLLTLPPGQGLSTSQLSCVARLFYREAETSQHHAGDSAKPPAKADLSPRTHKEQVSEDNKTCTAETDEKNGIETELGPGEKDVTREDRGQISSHEQPEEDSDWSCTVPLVADLPPHPWWDVMRAAQKARHSKHLRQLAVRAAHEGLWNCLICLAIEGLQEHPLDLLMTLFHENPEKLVLSFLRMQNRGQWMPTECTQEGWKSFIQDVDVLNLQHRGLLEERHRAVLLQRALTQEHWNTLTSFGCLDLSPWERREVCLRAMEERQWFLAMDMFDFLPGRVDLSIFQCVQVKCENSDELVNLMLERGLYNPYFAPEFAIDRLHALEEAKVANANIKPSLRVKLLSKSNSKLPPGVRKPNPPVTAEHKQKVTSTVSKKVEKAARKGDWIVVMTLYEGGMGGTTKLVVLQEAMQQQKWSVVTALIRRDPEAGMFYTHCRQILEQAMDNGVWSVVHVVIQNLGIPQEDRDWLLPFALGMRRWHLVLDLLKGGVSERQREEAVRSAVEENEWTFVLEFALMAAEDPSKELSSRLKKALQNSMTQLLIALQTSSTTDTVFGKNLFRPSMAGVSQGQNGHEGQGQGGHEGQGEEEERETDAQKEGDRMTEEWTTEDGTTALQLAARLQLWMVCKTLLLCGANADPPCTSSHPHDVILLAWRHNQLDVMRMLLERKVKSKDSLDRVLGELLLKHDLDIDAKEGYSLMSQLLERGADVRAALCQVEISTVQSPNGVEREAGVEKDTGPGEEVSFKEQISNILSDADTKTFQPCVANAFKANRIVFSNSTTENCPQTLGSQGANDSPDTDQPMTDTVSPESSGACLGDDTPAVGPRVALRVDRERLIPPLFILCSSPD